MTTKTWNFTLEGQSHTLTLEHGVFSGKRTIVLDGQLLEHIPRHLMDSGSAHEYEVDGHSVVVVIQSKLASFVYDLLVDGVSLDTGARGPRRVGSSAVQGAVVGAVLFLLIGGVISWIIKNGYDSRLAIQEWPVIPGNVTSVDANRHERTDNDGDTYTYYYPALNVEYVVNGSRYVAQVEDTDRSYNTSAEALAAHSAGESQALYVNPDDPREAELFFEKLDPNGWIGTVLLVMGICTVMSAGLIFGVWYNTRDRHPSMRSPG